MTTKKVLITIVTALLLIIIILFIGLYILFRASLPVKSGDIEIGGINSTIEILFDEKGIPQKDSKYRI